MTRSKDKLKTDVEYPRTKASTIQEAERELEYFRYLEQALELALKRIQDDLKICQKNRTLWEGRKKKLEEKT